MRSRQIHTPGENHSRCRAALQVETMEASTDKHQMHAFARPACLKQWWLLNRSTEASQVVLASISTKKKKH